MNLFNKAIILFITLTFLSNKIDSTPKTLIRVKRSGINNDAQKLNYPISWCVKLKDGKTYNEYMDVSKKLIREAISKIQYGTCVVFLEETNCPTDLTSPPNPLIIFIDDLKNRINQYNFTYSKNIPNPYEIKIEYNCNKRVGCFLKKILAYLGLILTHKRPDRDRYITINESSILANSKAEFDKIENVDLHGTGYDYGSVMHISKFYRNYFFGDVFNIKQREYELMTGQEYGPSFNDLKLLNYRYCDDQCPTKLNCQNGGYTTPFSCQYCECPNGYKGVYCDELDVSKDECGETNLFATTEVKKLIFKGQKKCNILIKAGNGKKIKIEVEEAKLPSFNPCFEKQGLEIKHRKDKSLTGLCFCTYAVNSTVTSEDNVVLIQYNGERVANEAKLSYQAINE
uniref:Metalloendopeptidase n=1 Tax=Strongyloides stercoralis TaxID=6248 RepID=A0A0K0EP00_STRER